MSSTRFIVGDVFDGLAALKAEGTTVDLVLSSPPFLALRSYLPADHPDKALEIGSEPTPAAFLSTMLDVVEACAEVLAPTGTLAFEFGDTYSGSTASGGDDRGNERYPGGRSSVHESAVFSRSGGKGWPQDKSLCMIPELFAASLAYGRNLLDPERTTDPWRIRNTIAWVRPNPPVGALGDKFRPAKSLITVAAKARDRWFDLDAVRTEPTPHSLKYHTGPERGVKGSPDRRDGGHITAGMHPAGAPPLDWWKISPGGYSGSHYAVWPAELLHRPIEAMCPRRVCRTCGTPSRREVERVENPDADPRHLRAANPSTGARQDDGDERRPPMANNTTGWTTCGCPGTDGIRLDGYHTGTGWRPGIVLDPFGGSGTSGLVANGLSRDAVLLDLDERNADLARERLGMFVAVEYAERRVVA